MLISTNPATTGIAPIPIAARPIPIETNPTPSTDAIRLKAPAIATNCHKVPVFSLRTLKSTLVSCVNAVTISFDALPNDLNAEPNDNNTALNPSNTTAAAATPMPPNADVNAIKAAIHAVTAIKAIAIAPAADNIVFQSA